MSEFSCAEALNHLAGRIEGMAGKDSRHTPHWNQSDQDAVKRLLDRPAAREQVALARIEGLTNVYPSYDEAKRLTIVNVIARRVLGLPAR